MATVVGVAVVVGVAGAVAVVDVIVVVVVVVVVRAFDERGVSFQNDRTTEALRLRS